MTRRKRGRHSAAALLLLVLIALPARGDVASSLPSRISGLVADTSGKPIGGARVLVKNAATGASADVVADAHGRYAVENLAPGDYSVSVSAEGLRSDVARVFVPEGSAQTVNLTVGSALSLGDLGFTAVQSAGSPEKQALLDKRSHMLKVHQTLGLITTVPLAATVILGGFAGGHETHSSTRVVHATLGGITVVLYGASAYYALFAPKIDDAPTRGNIRWHKALAWVHGAGMILTPILGEMAYSQRSKGESVHGIASAHGAVAVTTAAAYAAAILVESLK